jgi:hypothetical protein
MLKSFDHQDAKWHFDAPEWAPSTASFAPEPSRQYLKSHPVQSFSRETFLVGVGAAPSDRPLPKSCGYHDALACFWSARAATLQLPA